MKEEIKKLRLVTGMTVIELSEALGVSRKTIYDWEAGVYKPSNLAKKQIERVARQIKRRQR